jgi:Tol biopolymer transport system component
MASGAVGFAAAAVPGLSIAAAPSLIPSGFVAVTDGAGSLQISQFTLDGMLVRRLTYGPANHNYPSLSPDGGQLVFTGDEGGRSEIYRRELRAGAPTTQLTHEPVTATSPSWSPDGESIVYSALAPGAVAYQIFVAHADGTGPTQLTYTTDAGNTQPVFSPDGRRIAYISGHEAAAPGPNDSSITMFVNRIWVMNADGSNPHPLTNGPRDAYPQWLDSQTLFFAREDVARDTSSIVSVGLDGVQRNQSPVTLRFIEPRPLPDGRSYGATIEEESGLHLVRISRTDGASLNASRPSDFLVQRLHVPATDGNSFTLAWVMSSQPAERSGGAALAAVIALAAAATALIGALGLLALKKTSAC